MFGFATSNGPKVGKARAARALMEDLLGMRNSNASVIAIDRFEAPKQASASGFMTVDGRWGTRVIPVHQIAWRTRATTQEELAKLKLFMLSGHDLFAAVHDVFVAEHMGPASYTAHAFLPHDAAPRTDMQYDLSDREHCRSFLRILLGDHVVPVSYQQRNGSWFLSRKFLFTGTTGEAFVKLVFTLDATRERVLVNGNADPQRMWYTPARAAELSPLDVATICRVRARAGDAPAPVSRSSFS